MLVFDAVAKAVSAINFYEPVEICITEILHFNSFQWQTIIVSGFKIKSKNLFDTEITGSY